MLSFLFLLVLRSSRRQGFRLLLAFSGAFLLALTLFELLPEAYANLEPHIAGLCIGFGILLQIVLEWFSKGAEHGHVHGPEGSTFPWLLFGSLSLHAFLEGIPLDHSDHFLAGIIVHKIPVALIIGGFLLRSGMKTPHLWAFMILFASMTPLGALLGMSTALEGVFPYILALVIGVVLHVSTIILFETSEGHRFNLRKLAVILGGFVLAYFI